MQFARQHEQAARRQRQFVVGGGAAAVATAAAAELQAAGRAQRHRQHGWAEEGVVAVPADASAGRVAQRGAQREVRDGAPGQRRLVAESRARRGDHAIAHPGPLGRQRRRRLDFAAAGRGGLWGKEEAAPVDVIGMPQTQSC